MSASWYDVLGVEPTASAEEIRTAWRRATADLDPTDRRFDLYNDAAKVLLDDEARSSYDAELGVPSGAAPVGSDADEAPLPGSLRSDLGDPGGSGDDALSGEESDCDPVVVVPEETERAAAGSSWLARLAAPMWLLVGMAVAAVLIGVGTVFALTVDSSDDSAADAAAEAQAAAEANFGNVLTYRWDDLETAHQRAAAVLTSDYRAEFDSVWELVETEAVKVKAVVRTDVIRSGVVRASDDGKRVELAVVIRNSVSNSAGDQGTGYLMLGVTMVDQDGSWLIADVDGLGGGDEPIGDGQDAPSGDPDGDNESPSPEQ